MRVQLAPTALSAVARTGMLFGAAALVSAAMYWAKGAPTIVRKARFDEVALFASTPVRGVAELFFEALILVLLTWALREKLQIRL